MRPTISVVVPAFNEEACLREIHSRLTQVLSDVGETYEILIVDDGSGDGTFGTIRELSETDGHVRGIRLSRNFGHQAAVSAGLAGARGEAVISMDADLQHPPELIPALVAKWRDGFKVVATLRADTEGADAGKNLTSSLFYRLINFISPIPISPGAADFRLLDRAVVDVLNALPERTRFLRGLVPWAGFPQTEISFEAPARFAGKTKYTYRKMISFALNGILSLSAMPLRLATLVGLGVLLTGFVFGIYVVLTAMFNPASQPGWGSIVMVLLLLGGCQIFFLGVIGEYLARVFEEVKGRPLYVIQEVVDVTSRDRN